MRMCSFSSMQLFKCSCRIYVRNVMSFYAVARGRHIGVFDSWKKCEEEVKNFKGAIYKKFPTKSAAEVFINDHFQENKDCLKAECTFSKGKEYWPTEEGNTNDDFLSDKNLVNFLYQLEKTKNQDGNHKRKLTEDIKCDNRKKKITKCESTKIKSGKKFKIIKDDEFEVDGEGYVIVYTDGSCFNNGQKNACAGFGVYFGENHSLNIGKPIRGRVTNNVAEIQAAIYAIKKAQELGIKKLSINTDSQFLIKSITTWIRNWKANNWCLKSGEPVKNIIDFKELDALLQSDSDIKVKWLYSKGHSGILGNEMADKLAREGSQIYRQLHSKNKNHI